MAKKVTFIRGSGPEQTGRNPKTGRVRKFPGITTHWHIRKPHTKRSTLCGAEIVKGEVTTTKRPKPLKRKARELSQVCGFCDRISKGLDPVFQGRTENKSSRKPEDVGTRANPSKFPAYGNWTGGEVVA